MLTLCLIEDNEELGALTQEELIEAGYACDWYQSAELFPMSKIDRYHILLIDVMLPGKDGFAMAEEIRKHSKVGIIFLTAKADYEDVASGFRSGADDYMTKPFSSDELKLRIDALATRLHEIYFFQFGDIFIDWRARLAKKHNEVVHLTPTEREVTRVLLESAGVVCQRADLIEEVRGYDAMFTMSRSLDVAIASIRKKLSPDLIETIVGVGYKITNR